VAYVWYNTLALGCFRLARLWSCFLITLILWPLAILMGNTQHHSQRTSTYSVCFGHLRLSLEISLYHFAHGQCGSSSHHQQTNIKGPFYYGFGRLMVLTCMKHNILVRAGHIPGKLNILPDLLSRLQIKAFRARAAHMDGEPTPVPAHLLTLLWTEMCHTC